MSVAHLLNHMRMQAQMVGAGLATPRLGLISTYDQNNFAAKVLLQPENKETGWLPVSMPWVGSGWGMFSPPTSGDQVLILFQEGSIENGIIVCGLYSDEARPLPAPSGEFWLVHQSGASIKLTNDKKLTLTDGGGSVAVMNGDGTGSVTFASGYTINANTTINGTLAVTETISSETDVTTNGVSLKTHTHGGVQSGSSNTAAPNS